MTVVLIDLLKHLDQIEIVGLGGTSCGSDGLIVYSF